jgi:hypothetical protein
MVGFDERGGIDSPLAVDGIAVTAAWFAVLAPFVSRRGRRAGAPRRSSLARHAWSADTDGERPCSAGSRCLAKLGGGLLLRAGVIDWGGCHP